MKNKKRLTNIAFVALFVAGLLILSYPMISNFWNQWRADHLMSQYSETVENTDEDTLQEKFRRARLYNKNLAGSSVPDAFSIREYRRDVEYESLLDVVGDGVMGFVEIPSIRVSLPIYHYTTEDVLKKGAGHLAGSSLPVGGKGTHTVVSAHRGLPSAKMFTDLNLLEEGDVFIFRVLDRKFTYQVDQIKVVEPDETEDLAAVPGEDLATLVTCTPYGVNTQRLLVRGYRVPNGTEGNGSHNTLLQNPSLLLQLMCIGAGIITALFIVWMIDRRRKKKLIKK